MHVKYLGPFDRAIFSADDLKKAGVEGFTKTRFPKNEPIEVSDEVGKALIENQLFPKFEKVKPEEAEQQSEDNGPLELTDDEPPANTSDTPTAKSKKGTR